MDLGKFQYIAKGNIPDGYFGDRAKVNFYFDPQSGKTIAEHSSGYFSYHTPCSVNKEEALWLLHHHPSSNAKNLKS